MRVQKVMGNLEYAMTLAEVAAELGMTLQRAHQIEQQALRKVRARFGDARYFELFPEQGYEVVQ